LSDLQFLDEEYSSGKEDVLASRRLTLWRGGGGAAGTEPDSQGQCQEVWLRKIC